MARVISVLSGKGGVGKTFFSANVSAALSDLNKKTLAVDLDVGLRNLDLALGMQDSSPFDLADVVSGETPAGQAIAVHPLHKNLYFLGGAQFADFSDIPEESLEKLIEDFKEEYEYIIIDCPAGVGRGFKVAAKLCDSAVLVTTPENSAVRDCERTASLLRECGVDDIYLAVNRVRPKEIKKSWLLNIDDIIDTVGVKLLGLIPEDPAVSVRYNRGELAVDSKKAKKQAIAVKNIAKRITGAKTPLYRFW